MSMMVKNMRNVCTLLVSLMLKTTMVSASAIAVVEHESCVRSGVSHVVYIDDNDGGGEP